MHINKFVTIIFLFAVIVFSQESDTLLTKKLYYGDGILKAEYQYKNGGGGLSGFYKIYYKNGNIKVDGNYKSGKQIGEWK